MKKLIFSALSVFMLSSLSYAQTTSEAYQFSNNQLYGTARFVGLSGAFGALGGDLSAVSENPAGSAIFNNSFGSIAIGQGGSNYTTDFFNNQNNTEEFGATFNQIGGVLILKENDINTRVEKIALALNYNKTNDFDAEYTISGSPGNTIGDFFVGQANGISNSDLSIIGDESLLDAYLAIGNTPELGAVGQQAFLGFQSGLIDPSSFDDGNVSSYVSNSDGSVTTQASNISSRGSGGKLSFNLAAAYESGLHLGANINLNTFNRVKDVAFVEENNFARVEYNINEKNVGAGVSADFGLIYKLESNLRLGLVYQTPVYYSVITEVDQYINVDFTEEQDDLGFNQNVDPGVIFENELYTLQTPGKFAASAAYIFGKKGLISFEYNSQDFSNTEYGDAFSGADEINDLIETTFQRVNTYKLGAEIRNSNWTLRGGLSRSTTPYKNDNIGGDTRGFSLGTGYDWGQWRFDVAYNYQNVNSAETTFENSSFRNTANIDEERDRITVTLGINL